MPIKIIQLDGGVSVMIFASDIKTERMKTVLQIACFTVI